jgi:hypothetical protein
MSYLGVHFSIDEAEVGKLRACGSDRERLAYIQDDLEERLLGSDLTHAVETDKSWDAIHRALTDGSLAYEDRRFPYGHLILGGERLYFDDDYIMILKTPQEVHEVLPFLTSITKDQFRTLYYAVPESGYGFQLTEEDFEYTWAYLCALVPFWKSADSEQRYVLFTADQ